MQTDAAAIRTANTSIVPLCAPAFPSPAPLRHQRAFLSYNLPLFCTLDFLLPVFITLFADLDPPFALTCGFCPFLPDRSTDLATSTISSCLRLRNSTQRPWWAWYPQLAWSASCPSQIRSSKALLSSSWMARSICCGRKLPILSARCMYLQEADIPIIC